jgi:hypothetical protein
LRRMPPSALPLRLQACMATRCPCPCWRRQATSTGRAKRVLTPSACRRTGPGRAPGPATFCATTLARTSRAR